MQLWRICKKPFVPSAFSGIGAQKVGGRWNHRGTRMVYTASSLSLATLELFVHIDPALIPDDLFAVSMEAPEDVSTERLGLQNLPKGWRNYPAPNKLKDLGTKWIVEQRSLLLIVPSAVNPEENNILVNPLHPEFERLRIIVEKPFHFDPRMWKR